jgi:hypothetical protein
VLNYIRKIITAADPKMITHLWAACLVASTLNSAADAEKPLINAGFSATGKEVDSRKD